MTAAQPLPPADVDGAGEEFRRRLLDAMSTSIAARGYRDTTIADIVRHARTSRRTFYQHFTSKEDCFLALLREANGEMIAFIAAAVDRSAAWDVQVRQAIEAWIAAAQSRPALTRSWIRELPSLGDGAGRLQRETMHAFVALIDTLTDTAELRAAGVTPPPRQFTLVLLGGLRELIASVVEEGGDIASLKDVAVAATIALLGPQR